MHTLGAHLRMYSEGSRGKSKRTTWLQKALSSPREALQPASFLGAWASSVQARPCPFCGWGSAYPKPCAAHPASLGQQRQRRAMNTAGRSAVPSVLQPASSAWKIASHLSVQTRAMGSSPGGAKKLLRLAVLCPSSIAEWHGSTVRGCPEAPPVAAAWRLRWFSTCSRQLRLGVGNALRSVWAGYTAAQASYC